MWECTDVSGGREQLYGVEGTVWCYAGDCAVVSNVCAATYEKEGIDAGIRNAPYVFGVRSAATAIATGNTVVLKASEITPRCYWAVGKAFHEAGLPAGVLNVLSCPAEKAEEIVTTLIEVSKRCATRLNGG